MRLKTPCIAPNLLIWGMAESPAIKRKEVDGGKQSLARRFLFILHKQGEDDQWQRSHGLRLHCV
jgi:hypothetical protein